MGDFFNSPKEQTAGSLAELAMKGRLPQGMENALNSQIWSARAGIERGASRQIANSSADLMSQAASQGVGPGTALASILGKNNALIADRTSGALADVSANAMNTEFGTLAQLLQLGVNNMKSSTGFGDLMAGLSTAANIAAGVTTMGGSQGLGWWGPKSPLTKTTDSGAITLPTQKMLPPGRKDGFDFSKVPKPTTMLDWQP